MKSAARQLASRGFAVFPCAPFSKIPASDNGFRDAVTTREGIERLWGKRRWLNIGIATGEQSGVFVLDMDGPEGAASLAALESAHGPLPPTLESVTPNGRHLFFAWPGQRVPTSQGRIGPKLDVRGDGGCCMVPPSIHPSKQRYRWADENAAIAPAPEWLVTLATKVRERPLPSRSAARDRRPGDLSHDDVQGMLACLNPNMTREDWLRVGMALHAGGFGFEVWDAWSQPGTTYDAREIAAQWRSFKVVPGGVSMGTLVHMARQAGWEPERVDGAWRKRVARAATTAAAGASTA